MPTPAATTTAPAAMAPAATATAVQLQTDDAILKGMGMLQDDERSLQPGFFAENKLKVEFIVGLVLFAASAYYVMNSPFGKALMKVGKGIGTLIGVAEKLMGFAIFFLAPVMLAYKIYSVVAPDKAQKIEIERDWAKETTEKFEKAGIDPASKTGRDIAETRKDLLDKANDPAASKAEQADAAKRAKALDEGIDGLTKDEAKAISDGKGKLEEGKDGKWEFKGPEK